MSGGDGADYLIGGAGNDAMCGDAGADVFEFKTGDGQDEIKAFSIEEDAIHFVDVSADDLVWAGESRGLRVTYGLEDSLLLCGVGVDDVGSVELYFV